MDENRTMTKNQEVSMLEVRCTKVRIPCTRILDSMKRKSFTGDSVSTLGQNKIRFARLDSGAISSTDALFASSETE